MAEKINSWESLWNKIFILDKIDYYHLGILSFFSLCCVIFFSRVYEPANYIFLNSIISFAIIISGILTLKFPAKRTLKLFRRILIAPLVYFIYVQVQHYIRVINPHDYDSVLIGWDRFLFGADPTRLLSGISFPALTEFLQISYMTYFLMPLVQGIELHFKGDEEKFNYFAGIIICGFYLSYLLYFFMPAIGPRFTLHDFGLTSLELPGLWLTETLRSIVNEGGGIVAGALNPAAVVNRDCMPSGHTMITIINMILAFKLKSHFRWVFLIFGTSLIFATVYLRYHYVVDLLAGAFFAMLVIWLEPRISLKQKV